MLPRALLPMALAVVLVGCGTSQPTAPVPDATVPTDIATADMALPMDVPGADTADGQADAGGPQVPPAVYPCRPCLYDAECGAGGTCVEFDPMAHPGLRSCTPGCTTPGAACDGPVASRCQPDDQGRPVCTPTAACIPASAHQGAACPTAGCLGRYAVCAAWPVSALPAQCLAPCSRDSDCENGFHRCQTVALRGGGSTRACVPDDPIGPDACGLTEVNPRHVGAPCSATVACPTGLSCLTDLDPLLHGFCSLACTTDADCGTGARCLAAGAHGTRCIPTDCACGAGPRDTLLDHALAQAPWTRCNLYFSRANLDAFGPDVTRDRFRLPVFDRVHHDWLAGVRWARDTGPALDARVTSLSAGLAAAQGLRTTGDPASVPVPMAVGAPPGDAPLVDATVAMITALGGTPDRAALTADAADVPLALQRALAAVLAAETATAQARDRGLLFITGPDDRDHLYLMAPHYTLPVVRVDSQPDFTTALDVGALQGDVVLPVTETLALAATIEGIDWTPFRGQRGPSFTADTPLGRVVLRDGADHTHTETDFPRVALLVDLGGNDRYEAPVGGNVDSTNSVSVGIDLAGDDTYGYAGADGPPAAGARITADSGGRAGGALPVSLSETPRQGGGRLGAALLYDLGAGQDQYLSLRESQGFGALGVGGLYDDGGNDTYAVEAGGQGAAEAGLGVLVDAAGTDRYITWAFAQGFGYVSGVGLLYDRGGDDTYLSVVSPVLYGSPQDPTANSSFTQGAGFGRRADTLPDHINMAGGAGVLRDRAGDDTYTTGIFGQGTGYWSGLGLLLDGAGDDAYDGRWYVQAGVAHFAFGAVVDGGGADVLNAHATRQNMTAGAGHDFSLGIFLALGPEGDTYHVPNLALGAGNANGAGIFADEGGDDTYDAASSLTVGNAALETLTDPGRLSRLTAGIFLDGDGMDTYTRPTVTPLANNMAWLQRVHPEAPSETGLGADGTHAVLGF